jgi:hypothetical protein
MSAQCWTCGQPIARARVVLDRRAVCPDCVYELEYGPAERKAPLELLRTEPAPMQSERLFPLPPPIPKSKW